MVATSGTINGKRWRLAPCLIALFNEADRLFPTRRKASDGSIGDPAHQSRVSDHNPDANGWVDAGDITDDKASGCDADLLAQHLMACRDPRISYVIWNNTVVRSYDKPGLPAWTPEEYRGENPHISHTHISVLDSARHLTGPWWPQEEFTVSQYEAIMQELREIKAGVLVSIDTANKALDRAHSTYEKIVPTETVRADIRLTRDIAAKLGVSGAP